MADVIYTKTATKSLTGLPANRAKQIRAKIEQLATDPASLANQVKRLKGTNADRLRVGDYRVIFQHDGHTLTVLAVSPRGSAYR